MWYFHILLLFVSTVLKVLQIDFCRDCVSKLSIDCGSKPCKSRNKERYVQQTSLLGLLSFSFSFAFEIKSHTHRDHDSLLMSSTHFENHERIICVLVSEWKTYHKETSQHYQNKISRVSFTVTKRVTKQ